MRKLLLLFLLSSPAYLFAQDFYSKYEELMATGQHGKINALLELWEEESPDDENLHITGFNHYLTISRVQRIVTPVGNDSTQQKESYISSEVFFNDSLFDLSQKFINKAIAKSPKRLDLHFGKIHALSVKGDHRQQTSEILGIINIGDQIKHQWHWGGDEVHETPKALFTESVYEYIANLYNSNQYDYVQQISEKMIKSFPKEIASYSNLGACHLIKGDYKKAKKYFKKAYKLNKQDIIVLNNLGDTYDFMEKPVKAIKYFELMRLYGNDDEKKFALGKINNIKLRMSAE
ncbi:MAG: tetratricopeptide (TPR) repeat protein [Maribacter sp.]|jgi:tetratricopeptide (TPR) repeat protein